MKSTDLQHRRKRRKARKRTCRRTKCSLKVFGICLNKKTIRVKCKRRRR